MSLFSLFNKLNKAQFSLKIVRKTRFLKNVFNTQHDKQVLISYLSSSIKKGFSEKHTSLRECYTAAEVFRNLGYNVDLIDFDGESRINDFSTYDVIYGFGGPFEKSFSDANFRGKRILYSTGCNPNFTNQTTANRLKDFYHKTGKISPQLIRTVDFSWPLQRYISDGIVSLGNKFVADTYRLDNVSSPIVEVDLFYQKSDLQDKIIYPDYSAVKNNLIWFGSKSSVHKGLDIALDILKLNPQLKLIVCGYELEQEKEVYEVYKELFDSGRAVNCGFINIHSEQFIEIVNDCGAVLFPSAAEGGAAALLTLMGNSGIIPITTESVGLDLVDYGYVSARTIIDDINTEVKKYLNEPNESLAQKRILLKKNIMQKHDYELYKQNITKAVLKILHPN